MHKKDLGVTAPECPAGLGRRYVYSCIYVIRSHKHNLPRISDVMHSFGGVVLDGKLMVMSPLFRAYFFGFIVSNYRDSYKVMISHFFSLSQVKSGDNRFLQLVKNILLQNLKCYKYGINSIDSVTKTCL